MVRTTRWTLLTALCAALLFVGCQSSNQPAEQAGGEAAGEKTAAGGEAAGAKGGKGGGQQARVEKVSIPAGTALSVSLSDTLDTGKTSEGANFEGTLAEALAVNGVEVAPVGSKVAGKVTQVVSSGRLNRPAELALMLTSLTAKGGESVEIATNAWSSKGESHKKRDAEFIGGGAAAGALIGALAGGKKGALIGGAVGGGGGTGVAAYTGKKEIVLPAETKLSFTLSQPATVTLKR